MSRKIYHQRVYDTSAGWCVYEDEEINSTPATTDTTPNHTNSLVAGSHEVIREAPFWFDPPIRPVAADWSTPVALVGTTGTITIADVDGTAVGSPRNAVQISVPNPSAGAVVSTTLELALPNPLPSKFRIVFSLTNGTSPAVDYTPILFISNATETNLIGFNTDILAISAAQTSRIYETEVPTTGLEWDFASFDHENYPRLEWDFFWSREPLTDPALLEMRATLSKEDEPEVGSVSRACYDYTATTGTFNTGWVGEELIKILLSLSFPNADAGTFTPQFQLAFYSHPEDL